uniref:NR LBD domain-containing protein n=1 Tax=Caenorhabditis tropicalis TaxID=1561998 RepID=A0A1I7UA36_9PELO
MEDVLENGSVEQPNDIIVKQRISNWIRHLDFLEESNLLTDIPQVVQHLLIDSILVLISFYLSNVGFVESRFELLHYTYTYMYLEIVSLCSLQIDVILLLNKRRRNKYMITIQELFHSNQQVV